MLGFRFCALDPWNFWCPTMITGCATFGTEDPCEWKREHALPAIAEAHRDFYRRWSRSNFVSRESAVKVALSNGHARSCAPKLKAAGERRKTETDVPSTRDPMWLQFLVVFLQLYCLYHLSWGLGEKRKNRTCFCSEQNTLSMAYHCSSCRWRARSLS